MIILHIFKLEADSDLISKLEEGEHVIGRGPLLQCDDRRVSRNHGIIKITQKDATIISTHINPCFYQSASSARITILTRGNPMHLYDGDKFALLADKFWYKIVLIESKPPAAENNNEDLVDNTLHVINKTDEKDQSPGSSKMVKMESETAVFTVKEEKENKYDEDELRSVLGNLKSDAQQGEECSSDKVASTLRKEYMSSSESDNGPVLKKARVARTKKKAPDQPEPQKQKNLDDVSHDMRVREMLFSSDEENDSQTNKDGSNTDAECANQNNREKSPVAVTGDTEVKVEDSIQTENRNDDKDSGCSDSVNDTTKAGPSDTNKKKQQRERCWYGMDCYRKQPGHLAEYSHPGDSDYESDPNDDRPLCAFGSDCYRRNPIHRRDYRHPKNTQKPPSKRRKNDTGRKKRKPKQNNETPEDDYDLDDPFIDDSGSEYEDYSDSEDSDSDWSAGSEENNKRLLKEAKRFTRQKRKDEDD